MALRALSPLRHQCLGSAGCCHGTRVKLSDDEAAVVVQQAAALGVPDPVHEGYLRVTDGKCAFLGEGARCQIHGRFGGPAKPQVCQQFPIVRTTVEGGDERVGIDPSCYTARQSWGRAPDLELPEWDLLGSRVELTESLRKQEDALLRLLHHSPLKLDGVLSALCGLGVEGPLPEGFARRWVHHLQGLDLDAIAAHLPGPVERMFLTPLLTAIPTWDPSSPPPLTLGDAEQAWALEVCRRSLFLRLTPSQLRPIGGLLLLAGGALALSWAEPRPEHFGPGMAAWSRALRSAHVWPRLIPDPTDIPKLLDA